MTNENNNYTFVRESTAKTLSTDQAVAQLLPPTPDQLQICKSCRPDHIRSLARALHVRTPFPFEKMRRHKQSILLLFATIADAVAYISGQKPVSECPVESFLISEATLPGELSHLVDVSNEKEGERIIVVLGSGTIHAHYVLAGGCFNLE